jgi:hypothetical protein
MAKVIVVYGGGFQPFHAGHLSSYLEAKKAFPNADFYVAASNDTKTRPIPFNDKQFLAQQAGVSSPFVQVKAPINPKEILDRYDPKQDIFILVRSERDPIGYTKKDGSPGYYQPFVSLDKCEPFGYHGYVFVTHKKEFKLNGQVVYSGTQVRDMYANSDDHGRMNIIKQLYPQSVEQDAIKQMLDKYIGSSEPIVEPDKSAIKQLKAKKLKEQIQRMRPLLKEANIKQKYKFLKLMKESMRQLSDVSSKDYLDGAQRAKLLMKLLNTEKYELSDLELLSSDELVDLYRQEFTQELDEINFFHINKPTTPPKVDDYHELFKNANNPLDNIPKEKVYHSWEEFNKEQHKSDDVDETKLHQPKYIDLFYVHPKNNKVIKKLVVNMPFHRLEAYVQFLKEKGMDIQNLRYKAGSKEEFPYGEKISENPDYLEEK